MITSENCKWSPCWNNSWLFQTLMAVFWVVAPRSLVEAYQTSSNSRREYLKSYVIIVCQKMSDVFFAPFLDLVATWLRYVQEPDTLCLERLTERPECWEGSGRVVALCEAAIFVETLANIQLELNFQLLKMLQHEKRKLDTIRYGEVCILPALMVPRQHPLVFW